MKTSKSGGGNGENPRRTLARIKRANFDRRERVAKKPSASATMREIEDEVNARMSRLEAQLIQDTAQVSKKPHLERS